MIQFDMLFKSMRFYILLFFCTVSYSCLSQSDIITADSKKQIDAGKTVLFEGLLDSYHPIKMALVFDGEDCSGSYTLLSSDINFSLEGDITSDTIISMIELDDNDQISGYLMGTILDKTIDLTWTDVKKLTEHNLALVRVKSFSDNQFVPQEKSLVKIVGKSYGKRIDLWQNVQEKTINIVGDNFPFFNFEYRCNDDCTKIESTALHNESKYRAVQMVPFNEEKETITFYKKDGTKYLFVGKREETIYMKHKTFADYRVMIDLNYPVTRSFKFNQWIESNINEVQQNIINEINGKLLHDQGDLPEERYQYESYSWYDIDYISADIISGTITHTKSWKSSTDKIAFIFDNKEQKMLDLQDLFKSGFDYSNFITTFLTEQKSKLSAGTSDGPKMKWINGDNFDNISVSEMGLICNSDYSVIFGDSKIVIPFEAIKKQLKNKSIKSEFIN